jgi:UDP-3-O-[3-hydroxymyristoyl] N-acetylglucosamine deacetylase|tara:strand:- start:2921 stop:3847 length:927 start_codon:yes stop_codon:yes gene_type:complete
MQHIYQKTINKQISFNGVGLHSGKNSKITILPEKADYGIIFKRIDLKENNFIKANYTNVSSAKLCTTLENANGVKVSTVEHLLAALYIAGIDNALIEIDNEEIPIMDGSAKDFLRLLKNTETKTLSKKRKYLKILNKIELSEGEKTISIEPNNSSFEVDFQLNYNNPIIGKQRNTVNFYTDDLSDVSNSRTFCLFEDIEKIKKIGLAKGGSLDNAVVVDNDKVLNDGGLRNEKEFVNHKILDLAGDFLLSGFRIMGKVSCYQGGHELTNKFLRKLLKSNISIKSVELEDFIKTNKTNSSQSIKLAVNA